MIGSSEMKHTSILASINQRSSVKSALTRATGKFYTPNLIANNLATDIVSKLSFASTDEFKIADPFCGDGRLLVAFLSEVGSIPRSRDIHWSLSLWDYDENAVSIARASLLKTAEELDLAITLDHNHTDSFLIPQSSYGKYDCIFTNPPWETIKPDVRELRELTDSERISYLMDMKEYDLKLAAVLPFSQPRIKYAGWGTNLSRCGTELALKLLADGGICGIVIPLSLLTDQISSPLREWIFNCAEPLSISYYPAETKLFKQVDQDTVTLTMRKNYRETFIISNNTYDRNVDLVNKSIFQITKDELSSLSYCIPATSSGLYLDLARKWSNLDMMGSLEFAVTGALWLGRELDETRYAEFTTDSGEFPFIKGRMISRYSSPACSGPFLNPKLRDVPQSAFHHRVVWRDVSRRSQSRRMQATIIPPHFVTGNSLHVGFFKDDNMDRLLALLALMNSLPFEYQVRSRLGTGHISLGIVRQVKIPSLHNSNILNTLSGLATKLMFSPADRQENELKLEIEIAQLYSLGRSEYAQILDQFNGLSGEFKLRLLSFLKW